MDRNYLENNWVRKVWSPSRKKPPNTALNNPKIIAHCEECSGYETLVLFRSLTRLRIGEALAVNCGDIGLERNFIAVDKSVATGESGRLLDSYSPTKKEESRSVPLSPVLRERIGNATQGQGKNNPLFVGRGDERLNYGWFRRAVFTLAARRAGIDCVSIHTLRHTCEALVIQIVTPLTRVSRLSSSLPLTDE